MDKPVAATVYRWTNVKKERFIQLKRSSYILMQNYIQLDWLKMQIIKQLSEMALWVYV